MDADRGHEVESDGGVPPNPASEMDIGIVDDDLRELFAVLQRDDRAAIREANDEILAVIKSWEVMVAAIDVSVRKPFELLYRKCIPRRG